MSFNAAASAPRVPSGAIADSKLGSASWPAGLKAGGAVNSAHQDRRTGCSGVRTMYTIAVVNAASGTPPLRTSTWAGYTSESSGSTPGIALRSTSTVNARPRWGSSVPFSGKGRATKGIAPGPSRSEVWYWSRERIG